MFHATVPRSTSSSRVKPDGTCPQDQHRSAASFDGRGPTGNTGVGLGLSLSVPASCPRNAVPEPRKLPARHNSWAPRYRRAGLPDPHRRRETSQPPSNAASQAVAPSDPAERRRTRTPSPSLHLPGARRYHRETSAQENSPPGRLQPPSLPLPRPPSAQLSPPSTAAAGARPRPSQPGPASLGSGLATGSRLPVGAPPAPGHRYGADVPPHI